MATASAYMKFGLSSLGQSRLVTIFKIKELRQKIFITIAFLTIYRIGFHVPLPMIDQLEMARRANVPGSPVPMTPEPSGRACGCPLPRCGAAASCAVATR